MQIPDDLDSIIDSGKSFSLKKHDLSTTVGIISGSIFGLSHNLLVKRFNYRGIFDFIIHRLFNNRAKRLWDINYRLYKIGLPVPKPVMYTKLSFKQKHSFYISSVIENSDNLWKLYSKGLFHKDKKLLQQLADTIAKWHLKGAVHGDLKWPNILVQKSDNGYTFFLIDLDQSKLYSILSMKGIIKDLKRFYRFGLEIGAEKWVESELFPAYSNFIPDEIKSKIDLTDIINKALKEWIRKGRKRL